MTLPLRVVRKLEFIFKLHECMKIKLNRYQHGHKKWFLTTNFAKLQKFIKYENLKNRL